jgi:DNA-binding MarR family transcriptional regulator
VRCGRQAVGHLATDVTPQTCARAVIEAVPLVMRFIRGEMHHQRAPHLSVPQFRVLAFLTRHPGACLFAVADHLGVARPTASIMVDRLVRQGLVTRTEDPAERRRAALQLTVAGAQHFQRAQEATRAWLAGVLRGQSPLRLQQIAQGVSLLAEAFKALGNGEQDGK